MPDAHQRPETPTEAASPRLAAAAASTRSEAQVRAIRARRLQMEASYRAEGFPESHIAAHATDEAAERLLAYEHDSIAAITRMFGGAAA